MLLWVSSNLYQSIVLTITTRKISGSNILWQDFLKTMKNVPLGRLINDPKAAMTKVKANEHSSFLTGVSYYPSIPPRRLVSSRIEGRKIFYHPDTMIFISIPYLGLESNASALLRGKSAPPPPPGVEQTPDEMAKNMAKRLTGYHVVDNLATGGLSCNSSLSLLEHRYSSPDIATSDMWRKAWGETREERPVVHQMWFMVFDRGSFIASSPCFPSSYSNPTLL